MIVFGICVVVIVVFVIIVVMSDKVCEVVILLKIYKKGFVVYMNLFSCIYNNVVRKYKEDIFEKLKLFVESVGGGDILEIGVGIGVNFEFFFEGSFIIVFELNLYMVLYLRENVEKFLYVQFKNIVLGFVENMDGILDVFVVVVVCIMILCLVSDVKVILVEIKRVLKFVSM